VAEFKLRKRIIKVKSLKDYETAPDGDEMLIFQEEEPVDVEETIADDVRLLHRLFVNRFNAAV
jgi:hypothetical protein